MNGYLLIPLFATTACAVLAVMLISEDTRNPVNRRTALVFAGSAWWAACELLWNTASDPETALLLVRLSSLGWVAVGPLALDVFMRVSEHPSPAARRALPFLYGTSAVFALLFTTTDLLHGNVLRVPWGWSYSPARRSSCSISLQSLASHSGSNRRSQRSSRRRLLSSAR